MANKDFKLGDKVQLSIKSGYSSVRDHLDKPEGHMYGNPVGIMGEVITFEDYISFGLFAICEMGRTWTYVLWSNNMINNYPPDGDDLVQF